MHKPPLAIMASNDNSKHFRELGEAFEAENPPINILTVGGGELDGTGVFAITFDNDDDATLDRIHGVFDRLGIQLIDWHGVTVELPNVPGSLGKMAGALEQASINITSMLVTGWHGGSALVLVGVVDDDSVEQAAVAALEDAGFFVLPDHH